MTDTPIPSYPKVYNLGHKALTKLFDGPVAIQEKYDGSQLSWRWDQDGKLYVRSKGKYQWWPEEGHLPDEMFAGIVEFLLGLDPPSDPIDDMIFRGELINRPKHNTLQYNRVPHGNLILFDAESEGMNYGTAGDLEMWADLMGIEAAHFFANGTYASAWGELGPAAVKDLLENESSLGGPPVEGVVIKNYSQIDPYTSKTLMGKYVSEKFKEKHTKSWKIKQPGVRDFIQGLIDTLNTERRWEKAVEHLRDNGQLEGTPRDIGALMKEVKTDVWTEEEDWIIDQFLKRFKKDIIRGLGRGLPEWYKERLLEQQFEPMEQECGDVA